MESIHTYYPNGTYKDIIYGKSNVWLYNQIRPHIDDKIAIRMRDVGSYEELRYENRVRTICGREIIEQYAAALVIAKIEENTKR